MSLCNRTNCFLANFTLLLLILLILINGCASQETFKVTKVQQPFHFYVQNRSGNFVDIVQYKPCGAPDEYYRNMVKKLSPNEQIMSKVYYACIDLVAVDIFNKVQARQSDFWMAQQTTWHID